MPSGYSACSQRLINYAWSEPQPESLRAYRVSVSGSVTPTKNISPPTLKTVLIPQNIPKEDYNHSLPKMFSAGRLVRRMQDGGRASALPRWRFPLGSEQGVGNGSREEEPILHESRGIAP